MNTLTGKPISFWIDPTPKTSYSFLENSLSVDVAILEKIVDSSHKAASIKIGRYLTEVKQNDIHTSLAIDHTDVGFF